MNKNVKKAISLIRKTGYSFDGLTVFGPDTCPIAKAYNITTVHTGPECWEKNGEVLSEQGWTKTMLIDFIRWHDLDEVNKGGVYYFPNREKLAKLLEVGKNGKNHSRKGRALRNSVGR